jgi:hypothetical protein
MAAEVPGMDVDEGPASGRDHDDRPPRVFVSYAHESPQHKDLVLELCVLLRGHGIDVHLDEWDSDQRRDWYTWMIDNITRADYILIVASPRYKHTGDGGTMNSNNRGVQTETALLRDLMHRDRARWLPRMVPVVLPGTSVDQIPIFLQPYGASHYLITNLTAAGVEDLIRLLTRQPALIRPPLGPRPVLPPHRSVSEGVHPAAAAVATLPRDILAFTGRENELDQVLTATAAALVQRPRVVTVHAVDGMPGVGKTTFAVHAAHRLAEKFPDGQYFLDLHGHTPDQHPVQPADALVSLLLAHGVKAGQIPVALDDRARMWRDRVAGQNVLLVLDDAAGHDQVRPLLPGGSGSLVVITSRRRLAALEDVHPVPLDVLTPEQAAQMFHRLARTRSVDHDADAVAELMRLCGYLPLAIALQAGRLRSHPTWTVRYLTDQLAVLRDRLTDMHAENVAVAASFDLSYRDLAPDVQRLFRRLGLHPGPEIDVYAATALDDSDPGTTRARLESLYLDRLLDEPAPGRYRMHNLIRDYATTLAARDTTDDQATDRIINYYLHTTSTANRHVNPHFTATCPITASLPVHAPDLSEAETALKWLTIERVNLDACIDYAATHGRPSQAIQLVFVLNNFLELRIHWDQAATNFGIALTAAQCSGDTCGEANALHGLGLMQALTGNFLAAKENLARAYNLFVVLGDKRGEANALAVLGTTQRATGNYPAARESLTKANNLYAILGDTHCQALALYDLGLCNG